MGREKRGRDLGRKGWRGGRNAKTGRIPGSSTAGQEPPSKWGVHPPPPAQPPREEVPPRYPGNFFCFGRRLGRGGRGKQIQGGGGNTRGSVLSPGWPRRGQAGARRRCLSSRSLLGSDAAEAGGGEHPMPRMSWGSRGLHPADDGDKSERRPVFAGSAASWGAGFQGSRCPFGL